MEATDHRWAVISSAIVGFRRMTEADEQGTLATLTVHDRLVREQVARCRGSVIQTPEGGFLAQFGTSLDAVQCALALQEAIQASPAAPGGTPVNLRIGVHRGPLSVAGNEPQGEAVAIAGGLQSLTRPGRITISREVYAEISEKLALSVESLGPVALPTLSHEVDAYEILPGGRRRDTKRELRREDRQRRREARRTRDRGSPAPTLPPGLAAFEAYRQRKLDQGAQAGRGFWGQLVPFVAVNAVLAGINLSTTPVLWFLIPLGGWGIGLAGHASSVLTARWSARDVESLRGLSDEEFATVRRYQTARKKFSAQVWTSVGISGLLLAIGALVGSRFPWPLIPIGVLALAAVSRVGPLLSSRAAFQALRKRIPAGAPGVESAPGTDPRVARARTLRDALVEQAGGLKGGHPLGDDFTVTLDHYVVQIAELSAIERELGQVVLSFRPGDLDVEEATLRNHSAGPASPALKAEYQKALEGVERRRRSLGDLTDQRELISLRIQSALGHLQQMQVDLARIKGLSDGTDRASLGSLKDRSEELSRYLDDYREGLRNLPGE